MRGNGPTAMESKLGYLLSGPLVLPSIANSNVLHISSTPVAECDGDPTFWMVKSTGVMQPLKEESENNSILHQTTI